MARVVMTLAQAKAAASADVDRAKVDATAEEDIRRHMIEDREDPDGDVNPVHVMLPPAVVRAKTGFSQDKLAHALRIPVKTLRNWEQGRTVPDPAAQSRMALVNDDPERAFTVLGVSSA